MEANTILSARIIDSLMLNAAEKKFIYLRETQFIWRVKRSLSGIHKGLNMQAQVC